jgi:hypothetical protein
MDAAGTRAAKWCWPKLMERRTFEPRKNLRKRRSPVPGLATLTVVGVVVLAVLVIVFLKQHQRDVIGAMVEKRRAGSRLVTRADYVEGAELISVALALTNDSVYYENPDLEASFELSRIDEIEYSDELLTGKNHGDDVRVLRLRSHGAAFEFLMDRAEAQKWQTTLPPRTMGSVTAHAS